MFGSQYQYKHNCKWQANARDAPPADSLLKYSNGVADQRGDADRASAQSCFIGHPHDDPAGDANPGDSFALFNVLRENLHQQKSEEA